MMIKSNDEINALKEIHELMMLVKSKSDYVDIIMNKLVTTLSPVAFKAYCKFSSKYNDQYELFINMKDDIQFKFINKSDTHGFINDGINIQCFGLDDIYNPMDKSVLRLLQLINRGLIAGLNEANDYINKNKLYIKINNLLDEIANRPK